MTFLIHKRPSEKFFTGKVRLLGLPVPVYILVMRKFSACLFFVAVVLPFAGAFAQNPPNHPAVVPPQGTVDNEMLDGNYVLILSSNGKQNNPDLALITAMPGFNVVKNNQSQIEFRGRLSPQKSGMYLVDYFLSNGVGSLSSSVLLRVGEVAQIWKIGDDTYNLKLDQYKISSPPSGNGTASTPGTAH